MRRGLEHWRRRGGGAHDEDVLLLLEPRLQGDNVSAAVVTVKLVGVGGVALGASIGPKGFDLGCELGRTDR